MLLTCWWNVGNMSKCWRLLKNCVVLQHFVQHRHKICLSNLCWGENYGQTHLGKDKQTSKKSFRSLLWFLCNIWKLMLFILFCVSCQLYLLLDIFIYVQVVLTRKTTCCKSLMKCCFVTTSHMSEQQHFWPFAKKNLDMSMTCCMLHVVSAVYLVSQNTTCTTKQRMSFWKV